MIAGKESRNVPPNPTSQTSCQDHSGPMAVITRRRSSSVLPTMYCSMPAPMSKPSSTIKFTSMTETIAYQVPITRHLLIYQPESGPRKHGPVHVGVERTKKRVESVVGLRQLHAR